MKLDTDVRQLMNGKKPVYPTKRSMNLYFKEDRTTAPATAALYVLFAAAVLLGLGKIMVYDFMIQEQQMTRQAIAAIRVGDTVIGQAAQRYEQRLSRMRGGL